MKVKGFWFGGVNYSTPGPGDLEYFDSIKQAKHILQARADNDTGETPCVTRDETALWLYPAGFDLEKSNDNYPMAVLSLGPRGGVRVEH